jgi:hypothetical protein
MVELLSCYGFCCDPCLAYRPNIGQNLANEQILSNGWCKYFGFQIKPEKIFGDSCQNDQCIPIDSECTVRPCVIAHGLENFTLCDQSGCEKIKERLVTFEEIQSRFKETILNEDHEHFIRPYKNGPLLKKIRHDFGL